MAESTNLYISQNPFRIISVLSNSGIKEIHKNLSKLKAYSKLNKSIELEYDLNHLNLSELIRDSDTITKVESRILLDENKVKYSLFWFLDSASYDSIAITNLVKGNNEKALDIWKKAIKSDEISSKNYSAFNNISTLLMLLSLDESKSDLFCNSKDSINNLKQAINYKYSLISSDFFKNYYNDIGVTSSISISEIQSFFATTILEILNNNFSNKELVELLDGLDESFANIVNGNLIKEPISNIKKNIQEANDELSLDEKNGISIGRKLIKVSNKDLLYLKGILGESNYQYEDISDKLSNQILQCGILCFNATGDDQEYLSSYKYALSISISEKTKLRAENAIEHCIEEKEANICPACNKFKVNLNNPSFVTLYKIIEQNYWSNTVKYNQTQIKVFFCQSCKEQITKEGNNKLLFIWGIGGIVVIISLISELGGGSIITGIIGVVVASWLSAIFFDSEDAAIRKSKIVREYIKEGWQFEKPGK
jgi:hypothetical protein